MVNFIIEYGATFKECGRITKNREPIALYQRDFMPKDEFYDLLGDDFCKVEYNIDGVCPTTKKDVKYNRVFIDMDRALDFLDDWLERERFYDTIEDTELPVVEGGYVLSDSDIMFGKQIRKRERMAK